MAITHHHHVPAGESPEETKARRARWLAAPPSHHPETEAEVVELADLIQALVGDGIDPGHHVFATVWERWAASVIASPHV